MGPRSLARVAGDFIAAVQLVAEVPEGHFVDPRALRTNLIRELDRLAKHPLAQELDPQELDHARFALVAWADEKLLRAPWSGREEWSHDLLQLALYRTNRAGDEFYERLGLLHEGDRAVQVLDPGVRAEAGDDQRAARAAQATGVLQAPAQRQAHAGPRGGPGHGQPDFFDELDILAIGNPVHVAAQDVQNVNTHAYYGCTHA